jgi:very-short-patch-repair endonuclease
MYRDKAQRDFARTLRNEPTSAEKRLWHFLRAQKLHGYKFRRQAAIGAYVVDFVCFSLKLVVELDGPQHLELDAVEHDKRRTDWLSARGFHILRFRNQELDENIHAVIDAIEGALVKFQASADSPLPNPPRRGEGVEPEE